jgi:pimeloyl-ACP methyl ester carboxylesterase
MQETLQVVEVNGVTLHYVRAGAGRSVVLVHGNGESHELFRTQIRQLTQAGYQVYAPDSRGHGANEPMEEYHYADMAEDIYQFIRAMGLEKPALYGHSDGGIIGLLLAIRHPEALGALAISGTNLSPQGLQKDFLEEFTGINEKSPDPLITLMLTEPHIDPEDLRGIPIPVLVTVGENDLILPSETECIARHLPDARLFIVEGGDHGSYIVENETMGKLLLEFLRDRWK